MKTRTYKGDRDKLDRIEIYRKHFGWVTESRINGKLVMNFDKKRKGNSILRKLEAQADIIKSKFPFRMIPWLALCLIFLIPALFTKDGILFGSINLNDLFGGFNNALITSIFVNFGPIVFLVLGCINGFFAIYELVVFFVLKFTSHKTLEEIFRMSDALSGNIIDAPFSFNIAEGGPKTGILAITNIGNHES